ncbi:hypothetical protein [Amycolatopsis sp. NPDC051061]|uniref:hypothetical protein n=1 Tax=Amycolatopsis sp. NPDC051061 TaxID=3155042 RepID=UPI0034133DF8
MSRTNRTAATDTSPDDRHLQAVPEPPAQQTTLTTEDKVRSALADNPCATTAALAMAAGVGRSTAAKILARWGRDGIALRTAGDGPRNPDTWTLTPSDSATTTPDSAPAPTGAPTSADHVGGTNAASAEPGITDTRADTGDGPSTENSTATGTSTNTSDVDDKQTNVEKTTGSASPAPDGPGAHVDATPLPGPAEVVPAPSASVDGGAQSPDPVSAGTTSADAAPADKDRLPKGGLRAIVEEYLTQHPGESFGPAKIGKDLGRSGGAVNNALEALVTTSYAIKTCEAPKRFAINPDKVDAPSTAEPQ